jgi:hypothetical protein
MKKLIVPGMITFLAVVTLISLTGCINIDQIAGSKNTETRQFDYSGFKRIEVSDAFTVMATKSDTYAVAVTLNDNLFGDLDISMSGDTLRIGMKSFSHFVNTTQRAEIALPELDSLTITGACHAEVTDFQSNGSLNLEVTGASGMVINNLKAADTTIKIIGASYLSGSLVTDNGDFNLTGYSNIMLTGSAAKMQLDVIGASRATLADFIVENASVTAVGASNADVEAHGTLDLDISGVSTLIYGDSPTLGKVSVSGVSTLRRR